MSGIFTKNEKTETAVQDGVECKKEITWNFRGDLPDELYEAIAGGWAPIDTLRELLEKMDSALTGDRWTMRETLTPYVMVHNKGGHSLVDSRQLPVTFKGCTLSEDVSIEGLPDSGQRLCFARTMIPGSNTGPFVVIVWSVPVRRRLFPVHDQDAGSTSSNQSAIDMLTEIRDRLSEISQATTGEASQLISEALRLLEKALSVGRSSVPSGQSVNGTAPTNE